MHHVGVAGGGQVMAYMNAKRGVFAAMGITGIVGVILAATVPKDQEKDKQRVNQSIAATVFIMIALFLMTVGGALHKKPQLADILFPAK